jgi:hypothetical protein
MRDTIHSPLNPAPRGRVLLGGLLALAAFAAIPAESPLVSGTFNGLHGASADFIVGVGNDGAIVHFNGDGDGRRVPSGTTRNLLDVYVAGPDFAFAAGTGVVLSWNGEHWSPIVTGDDSSVYRRVWASPERDVVVYGGQQGVSEVVCPYLPGARTQPFCRQFDSPMVGACGHSDRIHIVLGNGDIHLVNNAVIDAGGTFAPLHTQPAGLQLTDAWFPEQGCPDDALPEVFATSAAGGLWHFDRQAWQPLDDIALRLAAVRPSTGVLGD